VIDLAAMAANPAAFRAVLRVERADGTVGRLGEVAAPFQAETFTALDAAWRKLADPSAPAAECRRLWAERHRGASKTADAAAMVVWLLAFSKRQVRGVAVAVDRDQARVVRDAVDRLARLNPWLAGLLTVDRWRVANPVTGSELEILAADESSSYGLLIDFAICDEVALWPDDALWSSVVSAVGKRPHAVLVCLTNCGWRDTWAWDVRAKVKADAGWRFAKMEGLAPWITAKQVEEQRRLLPGPVFRRLWEDGGRWIPKEGGDALTADEMDRAVVLAGPMGGPCFGWRFAAGLDVGTRRDFTAFVAVARHVGGVERVEGEQRQVVSSTVRALCEAGLLREPSGGVKYRTEPATGKLRLAAVRVWRPADQGGRVDFDEIEEAIMRTHQRLRIARLCCDPWQAEGLIQRLRKRGLRVEAVDPTGGNLQTVASELLGAFRDSRVELYPHEQLLADLRELSVVERPRGYRLASPRSREGGHGDVATAFALALYGAKTLRAAGGPRVTRPLIFSPPFG